MSEQAPAGWYPDGQGNERYWEGAAWTDQFRALDDQAPKKTGAFSKLGSAVKNAALEKKVARDELIRKQADYAKAAGALATRGVFGTSTIEIYAGGYVRVASWAEGISNSAPKDIDKKTPYERLRSITFTQPEEKSPDPPSPLGGTMGPTIGKLIKGGRGLMKASVPGMAAEVAAAGIKHLASNAARTSYITIVTDHQIHTLTNQRSNSVGLKTSKKGHNDVGRALEAAGNAALGVALAEPNPAVAAAVTAAEIESAPASRPAPAPTLADRLRELADLHREKILSDEEFAAAKAKLLDGL